VCLALRCRLCFFNLRRDGCHCGTVISADAFSTCALAQVAVDTLLDRALTQGPPEITITGQPRVPIDQARKYYV